MTAPLDGARPAGHGRLTGAPLPNELDGQVDPESLPALSRAAVRWRNPPLHALSAALEQPTGEPIATIASA